MPLSPVTPSKSNLVSPPALLGAAVVLLGAGFALGRWSQPSSTTIVHVHDSPPPVVMPAPPSQAPEPPAIAMGTLPSITWASTVRGFSSEYSTNNWSARQILGAPNVYPRHGDIAQAWASLSADDRDEWIEVGFSKPRPISSVEIYETYNPGAISKVELITTSGKRIVAPAGIADYGSNIDEALMNNTPVSQRHVIQLGCTQEPIAAVRVELASTTVTGWNELDAVGVAPCAEQ